MARQIRPRQRTVVRYHTPDGRRCASTTPGAVRTVEHTETWYARLGGRWESLETTDEGLAWQELRRRLRRRADEAAGIASPEQDDAAQPTH